MEVGKVNIEKKPIGVLRFMICEKERWIIMKAWIVIDVEMCRVHTKNVAFPCKSEIIQIGAVMMDNAHVIRSKFSTYVKPRFGKIDNYIYRLTGISDKTVNNAPDIEDALEKMLQWIGENDVCFYSWSATDYSQIRKEIFWKCHENPRWEKLIDQGNWIDYQQTFGKRLGSSKLYKLTDALDLAEVDVEGHLHDGMDDAYNTACLIAKLEENKDYKTILERVRALEMIQKPLTTSLGSVLQGIMLESA